MTSAIKIKKNLLFIEKNIINLKDFRSIRVHSNYAGYSYSQPYNCILFIEFVDKVKHEIILEGNYKNSEDANLAAVETTEKIFNLLINFNGSNKTLKENIII